MRRLLLFLAIAGCEPAFVVEGNAQTVAGCPRTREGAYAGTAAAGANVTLRCTAGKDQRLGQLDAKGHLHHDMIGIVDRTCMLLVEKDGYWPVTLPLADVCAYPKDGSRCALVSFAVDMYPKAPAP